MRTQKRFFYFALFIALFVIVIPFIVLHSMGYSFTSDAPLRGGIYVFSPESGSKIYIDDELKDETGTFQKEFFVQNLKPQQYRVVVSHEDFRPWAKFVDVQEQKVAALYPLLIPNDVTVQEIVPATMKFVPESPTQEK